MYQINHRIGIKASPEDIYRSLTTDQGLASWWTPDTRGAGNVGSIIKFRFGEHGPDFLVLELVENKRVRWGHSGNIPESWMGTEIIFKLTPDKVDSQRQTFVNFRHANWKERSDFMAHCNSKWAVFLFSLKAALETGQGSPYPADTPIDHS
jgi:uncharacterized protein YndB with AHSA1/START domain